MDLITARFLQSVT